MISIITWLVILILIIFSYLIPIIPWWTPLVIYLLIVFVKIKEKIENYKDWEQLNKRDEKLKIDEIAEDAVGKEGALSSIRINKERKAREDFEFERKKAKRKMYVGLVDVLFLK